MLPFHPGEALAIGAQAAIAGKVRRLVKQQRRLIRCVQRQAYQLVTALDFTDADPALPGQIEDAIRQLPAPFPAEPLGCCKGGGLLGAGVSSRGSASESPKRRIKAVVRPRSWGRCSSQISHSVVSGPWDQGRFLETRQTADGMLSG